MTAIPDDNLFDHAYRLRDKVVIITGAANGIGQETALRFASYGAKVFIGDIDVAGAQRTVDSIKSSGGIAIFMKCDVTVWEDQVAMFDQALSHFGSVDIVVPNAGVAELGTFNKVTLKDGKPIKPDLRTLDVNLIGALYTTKLALHYLLHRRLPGSLKAIILIGSMASWIGIAQGAVYAASKHAILGLMRSLYLHLKTEDVRIACIHPFFADTNIIKTSKKLALAGLPLTPVPRIAGAVVCAATDPNPETNGCAWLLADDGQVFMIPREEFKLGVYQMVDERVNRITKGVDGMLFYVRLLRDLTRILRIPMFLALLAAGAAILAWHFEG